MTAPSGACAPDTPDSAAAEAPAAAPPPGDLSGVLTLHTEAEVIRGGVAVTDAADAADSPASTTPED
jgi:hypothetical protein